MAGRSAWETSRGDAWALLAAGILGVVARLRPLESPDLLWQIRTGEIVLATHRRVTTDLFSFPFRGAPVHDHEAAFEAFAAFVHGRFGFAGLWWVNLVLAASTAVVAVHLARKLVADPASRVVGVACALGAAWPRLEIRPEHATFGALLVAYCVRREAKSWLRVATPIALAAVAALFHGLAPLVGLAPVAAAIGGVVERRPRRDVAIDLATAAACVLAAELVAPGTLRSIFAHTSGVSHIVEWYSPIRFVRASGRLFPIYMLSFAAVAIAGLWKLVREKRALASDVAFVSLIMVGALRYVRIAAILPIVAMPFVIAGVAAVVEMALSRARASIRNAAAVVAMLLAIYVVSESVEEGIRRDFAFETQPVTAVRWLQDHRPNAALFHPYNVGAYLIWERYPPRGVIFDGRAATLYPNEYSEHYYAALADPAQWDAWAARAPFDVVYVTKRNKSTQPLLAHLASSPDWVEAWSDWNNVVFERKK